MNIMNIVNSRIFKEFLLDFKDLFLYVWGPDSAWGVLPRAGHLIGHPGVGNSVQTTIEWPPRVGLSQHRPLQSRSDTQE